DNQDNRKRRAPQEIKGFLGAGKRREQVFRLLLPEKTWTYDKKLQDKLGAIVFLERKDPDMWLAVAVEDFGHTKPRESQLIQKAQERLEDLFGDTLSQEENLEPAEFAGRATQRLIFNGDIDKKTWRGECHMFTRRGLGFWVFLAGSSRDAAREELSRLQEDKQGLFLADERFAWKEQPP